MERGEFYALTGVSLRDVRFSGDTLTVEVNEEERVAHDITFIGTRRDFDATSEERRDRRSTGNASWVERNVCDERRRALRASTHRVVRA